MFSVQDLNSTGEIGDTRLCCFLRVGRDIICWQWNILQREIPVHRDWTAPAMLDSNPFDICMMTRTLSSHGVFMSEY